MLIIIAWKIALYKRDSRLEKENFQTRVKKSKERIRMFPKEGNAGKIHSAQVSIRIWIENSDPFQSRWKKRIKLQRDSIVRTTD